MSMWTHAVPGNEVTQRARVSALTRWVIGALVSFGLVGCAGMPAGDPLQVTVAGVEPLQGEGMELRMMVKLRVQNPNDAQVDYDGAYVRLTVQDKTSATGVSDARGLFDIERDALEKALKRANWNVSEASRALGVSRDTLRYRMAKFDLKPAHAVIG